jgi:hypothetical protein
MPITRVLAGTRNGGLIAIELLPVPVTFPPKYDGLKIVIANL